jgi:addiction module HigA family antidote
MKHPPHPGRIVRQEGIEPLGVTVTEAAAHLRATRQTLGNLANQKAGISPEVASRLSRAFGSSPKVWLGISPATHPASRAKREKSLKGGESSGGKGAARSWTPLLA